MKKTYEDDDNRTIADMSMIDQQSVVSGLILGLRSSRKRKENRLQENADNTVSVKERRSYIFGAMGAGLLIALIILAVFAAAIVVILLIGGVL